MPEDTSEHAKVGSWGIKSSEKDGGKSPWDFLKKAKQSIDDRRNYRLNAIARGIDRDAGFTPEQRKIKDEARAERAKALRESWEWDNPVGPDGKPLKGLDKALHKIGRGGAGEKYDEFDNLILPGKNITADPKKMNADWGMKTAFELENQEKEEKRLKSINAIEERFDHVIQILGGSFANESDVKKLITEGYLTQNEFQKLKRELPSELTAEEKKIRIRNIAQSSFEWQTHIRGRDEENRRVQREDVRKSIEKSKEDDAKKEAELAAAKKAAEVSKESPGVTEKVGKALRMFGRSVPEAAAAGIVTATGIELARKVAKVAVGTEKAVAIAGIVGAAKGGIGEVISVVRGKRSARREARQVAVNEKVTAEEPRISSEVAAGGDLDILLTEAKEKAEKEVAASAEKESTLKDLVEVAKTPSERQKVLNKMVENGLFYALGAFLGIQFGPGIIEQMKQYGGADWQEKIKSQQLSPELVKMMNWFKTIVAEGVNETT